MRFVSFVATQGAMPAEAVAEMNRDWPAHAARLEQRGGLQLGRELELPEAGVATVRVRAGQTLVTDGPFAETKEFLAGFGLFEADDMREAIELESANPVGRFNPLELRMLAPDFRLGTKTAAFAEFDDAEGIPHLLTTWIDPASASATDDKDIAPACEEWRTELDQRGLFVMGGRVGPPQAARTLRARDGSVQVSDGPFLDIPEFIGGIDVVRTADLDQAVALAATHPLARRHALEVRPFYTGPMP
ncbi:MAG: hypothetical protein KGL16_12455 [Acidobacteriota bacterium]|nr:hypothetical protein [Acidobacteriota bacterium]